MKKYFFSKKNLLLTILLIFSANVFALDKTAQTGRGRRDRRAQQRTQQKNIREKGHRQKGNSEQNNIRLRLHEFLEQVKEKDPKEYERLVNLRKTNRQEYFREIRKKMPAGPNEKRRKMAEIDAETRQLAEKYKKTEDEKEKENIKKELESKLEQSMNLLIEDTKERLERIQDFLNGFTENYVEIKAERLSDLISE